MTALEAGETPNDSETHWVTDGRTYDSWKEPPPFGHALKHFWAFDPGYVNLNNGSYGSLPLPVLFKCTELTMLAERNPDMFHRISYMPLLKEARGRVADLLSVDLDEIVLVPNTTHGLNTILRNFEWRKGDVILEASTTYGAISQTIRYLSDRSEQPKPSVYSVTYKFPMTHAEVLDSFRARIRDIKQELSHIEFSDTPPDSISSAAEGKRKNKIVAVIDSIISMPGVLLPWQDMVRACKEEGIWSVVDGAHSIGQENLKLDEAKPDFFVSNCHKWMYAKRSCAVLYVPKRNQYIMKSSLPTSHSYLSPTDSPEILNLNTRTISTIDTNFVGQHEWTGTVDQVPYLSVTPALDFRDWLGGEAKINAYCHELAVKGGKTLAGILGTKVMDESGELTLNMTNVLLPLPVESHPSEVYTHEVLLQINTYLRDKLLYDWNTYAGHYFHGGGWWCRCSAQVWNEISDFEYVGKAFNAICQEVKDVILSKDTK